MGNRKTPDSLWQWLVEAGEEKVGQVADEVLSNPRVTDAFASALRSAARTKGQVDKNVERLLGALNLPTRSDYAKLMSKVEALQGSLVNLNIKMDRLLAERQATRKRPAPPRRTTPRPE